MNKFEIIKSISNDLVKCFADSLIKFYQNKNVDHPKDLLDIITSSHMSALINVLDSWADMNVSTKESKDRVELYKKNLINSFTSMGVKSKIYNEK